MHKLFASHEISAGSWQDTTMLKYIMIYTVLSQHLSEETDDNHENPQKDSLFPGRDLNRGSSEYEARVLTTRVQRCVGNMTKWK